MTESRGSRMESLINRELSQLEFNQRVLALASDPSLPLLERLRFLCISSSNLDEFFEIRVAGLKQLEELGTQVGPLLGQIRERAAQLIGDQYRCLNELLLPELDAAGVRLQTRDIWSSEDRGLLEQHFHKEVEPVLSPLGLDPARPFPRIQNKSLNFIVRLAGKDAFGRDTELAVVQVPRSLPRVVRVPNGASGVSLVLLSNIVAEFVPLLFPGMEVTGCYPFRVTRNSDLFVDEEEIDDLRRALEGELAHRRYGASVRLETSIDCPEDVADFLLQQFTLGRPDLY
ncbi:MAG TPA: RNA degradosome polyphosphate kinase, partial [Steroidobacteraceae bacterium]|nr:RNA degradosome polyphosphate kinase [Steroidobacteraceae bacterium]